jgi:hypothetical protein
MVIELLAIFLDSGIIPTANGSYPVRRAIRVYGAIGHVVADNHAFLPTQWFAAIYAGLIGAIYWCLLINGFVGFQFAEDGTPMSLWVSERTRT